ncbi:MAG: HDIG domain-containing metalloprotein, partial [Acidobacteriota bacterium]
MKVNRPEARKLLDEHTQGESLVRHALAVEAAMRAYACHFGEDEDFWGITGLLHDFDYEKNPNPEDHPRVGAAILKDRGYPEDMIYA